MTTTQLFNCVFCKDVFENKEDLQEHFRKHGDPKFKNRTEVESQVSNEHEKVEMVSCDVCSQVFPTISKAITHKHKVHPDHDAKYFCPWCGKLFTMKHLYNVHVKSSHSDQENTTGKCFRCDICSVDFFTPSAMMNHNKFFHRQDSDFPDVGHSKKFRMYNQEVVQIYYCAFCGEEYENKVNLIKHMTDDHSDENQSPDEVLKCPLCEAVFYHLDAYEIHLTFHSPEDMYSVKNNEFGDLLDFSLESVPPIIEKVEAFQPEEGQSQATDPESAINAVGIEKFLELAMDQSDDSNPVKVKKHKKRKKSKKAAITLDEFLSMNQDVFGEGLDFQGIEEVPTRVVKKHLKINIKPTNLVSSDKLDKLKKAGIVIKKKVGKNPIVRGLKAATPLPSIKQNAPNKSFKIDKEREITTSSEVLTKLINQSNNQIRIVKKTYYNNTSNEPNQITKDVPVAENETCHENSSVNKGNDNNDQVKNTATPKPEFLQSEENSEDSSIKKPEEHEVDENLLSNKLKDSETTIDKQSDISNKIVTSKDLSNLGHLSSPEINKNCKVVSKEQQNNDKGMLDLNYTDRKWEDKIIQSEEKSEICESTSDKNSDKHDISTTSASSLATLKHLSHLITVKAVTQNKTGVTEYPTNNKITEIKEDQDHDSPKSSNKEPQLLSSDQKASPSKPKLIVDKDPSFDALKNLSKNITIKSISSKRNVEERESEEYNEIKESEKTASCLKLKDVSGIKNLTMKKIKVENGEPTLDSKVTKPIITQDRKPQFEKSSISKTETKKPKINVENTDNIVTTSNANILKRLSNITTKQVVNKNINESLAVKQTNMAKKILQTKEKKEEVIEIFDIDDSEDETETSSPNPGQNAIKSMDALKHLSKNVTIKSYNHQPKQPNFKHENNIKVEKECENTKSINDSNMEALLNIQNRNMAFKNVLQGLSKNITIKSQNSSPSHMDKSHDYTSWPNSKVMDDSDESDTETVSGNIKITEINDMSDIDDFENINTDYNNPIVESPDGSCSEHEERDEAAHDIEADIQASTMQKSNETSNLKINSACFKNISKNITIKSLGNSSTCKEDVDKSHQIVEQKKPIPVKSTKLILKDPQSEDMTNMSLKMTGQGVNHTSTQCLNQKNYAINQVNTINKEVTVKTIQTKTVIQEITTTVTKTIKTVNQTMNQEVRNICQTSSPMVTQKVQGLRPNPAKNLQGVVIRHASPNVGPRISNVVPQIRPSAGTVIRPARQAAPARTGSNPTRPNNPRMAIGNKNPSASNTNSPVIGRPLKISPSAMVKSNVKRPNTEDVSGPFSCFKKPKESLIPVSDVPTFTNSVGEGGSHFTAASHTSTSNFTSTTKTVKGNSVVTAKQMKSEVCATQQLRMCDSTGMKIMSSQAKQTQVQEKSENSAMKKTTLEAIQRLQKQGLLVKKPRVEVNQDSAGSDNEGNHNVQYNSDEPNE